MTDYFVNWGVPSQKPAVSATASAYNSSSSAAATISSIKKRVVVSDIDLDVLDVVPTKVRRLNYELETVRKELAAAQAQLTMKEAVIEILVGHLRTGSPPAAAPTAVPAPPVPAPVSALSAADGGLMPAKFTTRTTSLHGIDTICQSMKIPNLQIRPDPPILAMNTGPFNQSILEKAALPQYAAPAPAPVVVPPAKKHTSGGVPAAKTPARIGLTVAPAIPAAVGPPVVAAAVPKQLKLQLPPVADVPILPEIATPAEEAYEMDEEEEEEEEVQVEQAAEEEEEEEEEDPEVELIKVVHHPKKPPMSFFFAPATKYLYRVATDADGDATVGELVASYDPVAKKILERYAVI